MYRRKVVTIKLESVGSVIREHVKLYLSIGKTVEPRQAETTDITDQSSVLIGL